MNRIKFVFLIIIFCNISIFSENYNLENGIILNDKNASLSTMYSLESNVDLKSPYDKGTITRYSNEENNITGLGKFVEIEYQMGFMFENTFIEQGVIKIIFSNIDTIYASKDDLLSKGDNICSTKSGSNEQLRVFIISETDDLQFLKIWTQDRKFKLNNIWYWDSSFLFR